MKATRIREMSLPERYAYLIDLRRIY